METDNDEWLGEEIEKYINQDQVKWTESPISIYVDGEHLRVYDTKIKRDKPFLSNKEKAILCRLGAGMTREEIAEDLNISIHYVRTICWRVKNKASQLFP